MADGQQFDVDGARKAGYSDDQILLHLRQNVGTQFDVDGAIKAGFSKGDVINELAKGKRQTAPTAIPGAPNGLPQVPGSPSASGQPMQPPIPQSLASAMEPSPYGAARTGGFLKSNLPKEGTSSEYSTAASLPMLAVSAPSMIANPLTTIGTVGGGFVGGKAAKYEAKRLGAGSTGQDIAETAGNLAGGFTGGMTGSALSAAANRNIGAQLLNQALAKGSNAPVEISSRTDAALDDLVSAEKTGGKLPKVVTDLLKRLGPSTKEAADAEPGPLTYQEARGFQKNISGLSVEEKLAMNKDLKRLMPELANSFSKDVQAAADKAGFGDLHAAGLGSYAQAARIQGIKSDMGDYAWQQFKDKFPWLVAGSAAGAAYKAYKGR
jgi:hypothetical protein